MADRRDEPGPIVERAIGSLRALPTVDAAQVARIVDAAARTRAQDATPNEDDLLPSAMPERASRRGRTGGSLVAASLLLALGVSTAIWRSRGNVQKGAPAVATNAARNANVPAVDAAASSADRLADAAFVPTQFVFDGRARRVALVGDFNNWDEHATPLEREPGSTLWSVTVPIQRGRHIYAFLVDSVWTVDKRAPVARDPDFGVTGSVILVGRP